MFSNNEHDYYQFYYQYLLEIGEKYHQCQTEM